MYIFVWYLDLVMYMLWMCRWWTYCPSQNKIKFLFCSVYCFCYRATGITLYDIVCVQQACVIFHCVSFFGKSSKLYTDRGRKLNWSGSYCHNICQDSFLSSLFNFVLFYWACNHSFTTAHFSHVCFLQLSVSSGDQAFSFSNCRA